MEEIQIKAIIEALIFVSESPVSLDSIREVLGDIPKKELQRLLGEMTEEYQAASRGFNLIEVGGGYQFRTRTEYAEWVKKLKKIKPFSLSQPSLETLAIVAYKQPVLRTEVEKIRGVDSGGVLRTLLEKKLIKILGKKDVPGKPLVYGTSKHFLEMFGLKDLSGLPTLKDLAGLGPPPPQEQVLPLRNGKSDEEEAASREEE
ncbi:MAG: scpB, partial [Deltaproteobacteria bacterium]|nr:scpB [Deltaproteobacteria bacterium]